MLRVITNDSNWRAVGHAAAGTEPRRADIRRTGDGALITFSDGDVAALRKEPHVSEGSFMAAVLQWAQRHGARSFEVEYE